VSALFIADLHLAPERPAITALFLEFLRVRARQASALYILGDLFEAWIGDDDDSALAAAVCAGLRAMRDAGTELYFLHGNRDFLLGERYAAAAGMALLPESSVQSVAGQRALLLHGDTLCTDDAPYQAFRRQTRDPVWQASFLQQSLTQRRAFAAQARSESARYGADLAAAAPAIADVTPTAVAAAFARHDVALMIHGHTHRPALHHAVLNGRTCLRVVLGDWYHQGSVLRLEPGLPPCLEDLAPSVSL
jgi:UDP-2,3-diacylglucosamine hydrolase